MIIRFFMKPYRPMNRIWSSHTRLIRHGVMQCCRMCHHCLLCGKCASESSVCRGEMILISMVLFVLNVNFINCTLCNFSVGENI